MKICYLGGFAAHSFWPKFPDFPQLRTPKSKMFYYGANDVGVDAVGVCLNPTLPEPGVHRLHLELQLA